MTGRIASRGVDRVRQRFDRLAEHGGLFFLSLDQNPDLSGSGILQLFADIDQRIDVEDNDDQGCGNAGQGESVIEILNDGNDRWQDQA